MDNSKKYVSFQTATLLRDKGYDEECSHHYDLEYQELSKHFEDKWRNSEIKNGYFKLKFPMVSAPLISDVVDWLLDIHGFYIYSYPVAPFIVDNDNYPKIVWVCKVCSIKQLNFEKFVDEENGLAINHHMTKEMAIESGIRFLLK
jgi:hypothetical protein